MTARLAELRPSGALGLALVSFAVGQAVQVANGNLHELSIRWLALACVVGLGLLGWGRRAAAGEELLVLLAGAGVAWELIQLFTHPPGIYLRLAGPTALVPFYGGLATAAVLVGAGLSERPWGGRLQPWLLVLAFLFLGRWLLAASPSPHIDVFVFQRDGAAALLSGQNPYALRYPDIYGNSPFYGPGLSVNGQLQFGFPYFPLSLLLTLPAHGLLGDYRWTQLLAMAVTAVVMMQLVPTRAGRAMAALFLFTPRSLFVLEQGWTEPLVLALLSLTAWVAVKRPSWLPWAFGLLVAVKQYTVFMLPLGLLLVPRAAWTLRGLGLFFGKAALAGAVVTVPFFLWGPGDFWFSVVKLQVLQPFRVEALSFLAWWKQASGTQPATWWPFVVTAGAVAASVWRLPRTAGGFLAGVTVSYLAFFATNKQAFCNYYYLVIGAAALAAALASREARERVS